MGFYLTNSYTTFDSFCYILKNNLLYIEQKYVMYVVRYMLFHHYLTSLDLQLLLFISSLPF